MELVGQVAYTKARLKSVLPTEKKKKKESQVSIIYHIIYETDRERNHDCLFFIGSERNHMVLCFQVSQAPLIPEVVTIEGENSKPRRWSQVCLFSCLGMTGLFVCLFYLLPCLFVCWQVSKMVL